MAVETLETSEPVAQGDAETPRINTLTARALRMPGPRKAAVLLVSLGTERAASVFRRLRDENLAAHPTLTQLSMGMSNDFAVAIEEGSTTIRIGTAIFVKRTYA